MGDWENKEFSDCMGFVSYVFPKDDIQTSLLRAEAIYIFSQYMNRMMIDDQT